MNIFNFIKSQISILDVVKEYTTLKPAGTYHKGTCPFHHEKTASFTVSPHKGIFYCFGCHKGGDVISFIASIENCSQLEAAQHLADRYNIDIPDTIKTESSVEHTADRNHYFELCKYMALWSHDNLKKSPSMQKYISSRGFNSSHIDYFKLGYFPGGFKSIKRFIEYMNKQHIIAKDLIEAHILIQGKTVLYSPFEERLIFPIKDHLGRFCGFGGRIFKKDDERPKYYNSRENEFFAKGSILFGLDLAKKSIQKTGIAYLVEGYTDCMAMVQHGFSNTIATLGTACTLNHLKALARYAEKLYVLYDGDNAGQQAIMRLTELCWQVNLELKVISLPAQEDPASFLMKNNDLLPYIHKAQDIFFFFIASLGVQFSTKPLNQKVQLIRKLLDTIACVDDPLKQDILLQRAAKTCDIPFESLKQELARQGRNRKAQTSEPENKTESSQMADLKDIPVPKLEKKLFCAIMQNIQLFNNTKIGYLLKYMPNPLQGILQTLKNLISKKPSSDFTHLFDLLDIAEKQYVSKLLLEYEEEIDAVTFEQLVQQLQKKQWKLIVHDIKTKLAYAKNKGDDHEVKQIVQDFIQLKQKLMPPISHDEEPINQR